MESAGGSATVCSAGSTEWDFGGIRSALEDFGLSVDFGGFRWMVGGQVKRNPQEQKAEGGALRATKNVKNKEKEGPKMGFKKKIQANPTQKTKKRV